MQIEATSRGEWVLETDYAEPSRSRRAPARGSVIPLTWPDRIVVTMGAVLFALAALSLGALVLALPRLYTPMF
jgi:hypothetical protein